MKLWKKRRPVEAQETDKNYARVIARTAGMVSDRSCRKLASKHGLDVLNITWEDTARFKDSCVGPNISDMTIQARHGGETTCMPVIRFPNFSDETGDVSLSDIFVPVGNECDAPVHSVSLRTYLGDLRRFLTDPSSWTADADSLLVPREEKVLISAQACFLPVPREGRAEFNPVLFNYQSAPGAPAVLAIVATREGTSATVIDNDRDGFSEGGTWGQRLFFNKCGERACYTGTRLSDFMSSEAKESSSSEPATNTDGLNCVMLIQVPLLHAELDSDLDAFEECDMVMRCGASGESNVEEAVIGHGEAEGPFTEIDGLSIERDPRYPIRVTFQFYKATSNGVVSESDMSQIAEQIESVYRDASAVGSLVTGGETDRPTEWTPTDPAGDKSEPDEWWEMFWRRQEAITGRHRLELLRDLQKMFGSWR